MTPEDFRRYFESRTLAYAPDVNLDARPVVVVIGEGAHSRPGHVMLVSLANLLGRAHRRLEFVGNLDRPFIGNCPFGSKTVGDATVGLVRAINPFIEVTTSTHISGDRLIAFGVGADNDVDVALGCEGWRASLGPGSVVDPDTSSIWGAMLAAVLAAAASFNLMRGVTGEVSGTYSLWRWGEERGEQGPRFEGPIDVGRVLQVGAGGVGAALDFFAALAGVAPGWRIVDGDDVDVSNLNRQLMFLADHAGYNTHDRVDKKAEVAARALGAECSTKWYGSDVEVVEDTYELVLALANEHGARSFLQARQPTVLLHATTSTSFGAQFHRHISGIDDCIECRLPPGVLDLSCGGGEVKVEGKPVDAAIGHLSAAAGLLLLAGLIRLQLGQLADIAENKADLTLEGVLSYLQVARAPECKTDCQVRLPASARAALNGHLRFAALDPKV